MLFQFAAECLYNAIAECSSSAKLARLLEVKVYRVLKLFAFGIVIDVIGGLTGIGWIATLIRLYLIYKGMSNALNGRKEKLPWIGNILE